MTMYVCEACREDGKVVKMPADEIGASLMQQHLKSEHDVALAGYLRPCQECGLHVLVMLGREGPTSCGEHST